MSRDVQMKGARFASMLMAFVCKTAAEPAVFGDGGGTGASFGRYETQFDMHSFVCPSFVGSINTPNPTAPQIKALNKRVALKSNVVNLYTHTSAYICGAWGGLDGVVYLYWTEKGRE